MLGRLMSGLLQAVPQSVELSLRNFGTIFNGTFTAGNLLPGGNMSLMQVRTRVRYHFPIARETKRIKVHGYKTRMSTPSGRKILMRRILKGKHCLSH